MQCSERRGRQAKRRADITQNSTLRGVMRTGGCVVGVGKNNNMGSIGPVWCGDHRAQILLVNTQWKRRYEHSNHPTPHTPSVIYTSQNHPPLPLDVRKRGIHAGEHSNSTPIPTPRTLV